MSNEAIVWPDAVKPRTEILAELDRLRALRAALVRADVQLRSAPGTVMHLDFVEKILRESAP